MTKILTFEETIQALSSAGIEIVKKHLPQTSPESLEHIRIATLVFTHFLQNTLNFMEMVPETRIALNSVETLSLLEDKSVLFARIIKCTPTLAHDLVAELKRIFRESFPVKNNMEIIYNNNSFELTFTSPSTLVVTKTPL